MPKPDRKPSLADTGPLPPELPRVFTFNSTGGDKEGYPILICRHTQQKDTLLHEHAYHEIVLVESGTAGHISAEGTRRLAAGDIITIKPRMWHRYVETKRFGIVNCLFDRRILLHQKVFLSLANGAFELFQKPVRNPAKTPPTFLHATPAQREQITSILSSMIYERQEKQIDWQGALVSCLLNLIVKISRIYHGTTQTEIHPVSEQTRDLLNKVLIFLESHFRERITLEQLSREFHISPFYLSRAFTKRVGMGIVDYINHLRIEAACELLRHSDWPVTRIAGEVGYDEIPYFFRRFRREIGKSPGAYRSGSASP